jgi:hypothetical protein
MPISRPIFSNPAHDRKEGKGLLAISAIVTLGAFLLLTAVWRFFGTDQAGSSIGDTSSLNLEAKEAACDLMKQETPPAVVRFAVPLQKGSHAVADTPIRVKLQLHDGEDGQQPTYFRKLEIIHEGPHQKETLLLSLKDQLIARSMQPAENRQLINCCVMAEWFEPKVTETWGGRSRDFVVMILAIQNLSAANPSCPALAIQR